MSPRSAEFMQSAQERLAAARAALASGFPEVAVSAAYYGALYAARAALSEQGRNAKTHRGVWSAFGELVAPGGVDPGLLAAVRRSQELREAADYDAREIAPERAEEVLADAERFVAAVSALLR